jgi:hypothetical protein
MDTERRSTKPSFVQESVPQRLRPDILKTDTFMKNGHPAPMGSEVGVWIGPGQTLNGYSEMAGPSGFSAAYDEVVVKLVNLAYFWYNEYLASIDWTREEERGTSFDGSAE